MVNITPSATAGKKNHAKKSTGGKAPKKAPKKAEKSTRWPAKKSTGGPAPRLAIGAPAPVSVPPVLGNAVTSTPDIRSESLPLSTLHEDSAPVSSEPQRRSERMAVARLASGPRAVVEVDMSSEKDGHCSNMELDKESEDAECAIDEHLCAGCQDGGSLLHCEGYRLAQDDSRYQCGRLVCYGPPGSKKCIELHDEALENVVKDKAIGFVCPACWEYLYRKSKYNVPYMGFFKRDDASPITSAVKMVHSARASFFSKLELVPMAIISIALEGMATEPFSMTLIEVQSYYLTTPIPCIHASLAFDLSGGKREQYDTDFAKLFALLKEYNIKRIVVFLTTHSTPDGDLHFIPNMGGAAPTSDVLDTLFPAEFQAFIRPSRVDSTLFVLSCGGVYLRKDSYDSFTELARAHIFERIIAFPARDLQPLQTARWCQDFVRRILLQHESIQFALKPICDANPSVGAHTNIIIWHWSPTHPISLDQQQMLVTQKIIWCHSFLAPYGMRITEAQCPHCCCLRTSNTTFYDTVTNRNGEKFLVVNCTAKLEPPLSGPRGGTVPQVIPPPCKSVLIPLVGCYASTSLGTKRGNWEIVKYQWTQSEGQYLYG
ncbi:hypothetical protein EV361DRAFT_955958 [Lentinula raphanica]|nr:hypothetical protein EV361DRAFT_955958 [Lentinula raphanica]